MPPRGLPLSPLIHPSAPGAPCHPLQSLSASYLSEEMVTPPHTSLVESSQPAPAQGPACSQQGCCLVDPTRGQAGTPPLAAHLVCLCPFLPCTPKHSDLCVLTSRLRSASPPTSARWRTSPSRCLTSWTRSTTSRTMTLCSAWVCGPWSCHSGQHLLPCRLEAWAPSLGAGVRRPGLLVSLEEGGVA